MFHKCGKARCGCGERMCRSGGPGKEARKHGAGDRRGEDRRFAGSFLGQHCGHLHGQGAMVNAVTAAAGRQARVIAGLKQPSERAEAKEKHQDEGSRAAHLVLMVHEHKDGCVGSFIIVEIRNFSCSKEKTSV